ncbi:hypothetical protein UFOVP338_34 [uncultured Caudovirales phage]|uniref:Uncharacterized protein n=1 Tax=uncultured Caudovirales phage TaxID=2100421 RepID=A0A6J5M214_9CAUD|nr:hypothetical protein UFOVP338_34 [uncultured Caudovirales phage]
MALPWQDISTLKDSDWDGMVLLYQPFSRHGINGYDYRMDSASHLKDNWEDVCKVGQWLSIPTPEAKTVEAPVEPERVSVQEFAKDPAGKWVNTTDGCPIKGWYQIQKEGEAVMGLPFKLWDIAKKDHPIYATDPTAWLAWLAKQEGNQ